MYVSVPFQEEKVSDNNHITSREKVKLNKIILYHFTIFLLLNKKLFSLYLPIILSKYFIFYRDFRKLDFLRINYLDLDILN